MKKRQAPASPDRQEMPCTRRTAARLARVSLEFIHRCERQALLGPPIVVRGKTGFPLESVHRLKRIRHLHVDLGLELEAVDFILRMRQQMSRLQNSLAGMEQRLRRREQELLAEIQELRQRLGRESDWD